MPAKFVHLHTHSHYSLLDGLSKTDDLIKKCQEFEMPALAITDHGNMYGAVEFYKKAKSAGIKPIIGVEGYMAARSRFQKEANIDAKRYHITLLAENEIGYRNLLKLVSKSYLEGYYYKPRMDKELLAEHREGIICLSGCLGGELSKALWNKDKTQAKQIIKEYQDIFGANNYYLEIMHHEKLERQLEIKAEIITLAHELNIPLVATYDSHYINKEDNLAHHTLVAIQSNTDIEDTKRFVNPDEDFSFISPAEAEKIYSDAPESATNTVAIADRCELELTIGKFVFPNFSLPVNETADEMLERLAFIGLEKRGLANSAEAIARLKYELDIIKFKGYASYFLVVEDLIRFAREKNIYYNIRGSVAGSMTTYALDITKIDPLAYNIPFERFLNPERPSAPDIDMDFADNRRNEIIDYAKEKYGDDKVAQIGTFGSMLAKGSVRDVARALGYPYAIGDKISNLIPPGSQGFPMTIKRALEIEPELKKAYSSDPDTKKIIDLALKIEGCVRHISVHAAGVVIAPDNLTDYTPLQYDPKGASIITQYDMYDIGEDGIGLTKFDFLGLRNLAILASTIDLVEKVRGIKLDIENIPVNDEKTFAMLARGETEGLFQLNGAGMTRWLKELKPTTIHDINAMVALYRPGPMQFIPEYIERKHNPKLIKYLDPSLEKILNQTYGVLVYQDDLLIMAHDLAGYTWGEVDKFRKAVGKKIPAVMQEQKEKFIKGCVEHSKWTEQKAKEIWAWIEPFAAYGFNKAHSASYGRVAYQTAYMKANFPVVYMCSCLTAESGDIEQIALYINECKRMNIAVFPPDVNESFGDFTVVKGEKEHIRFGLYTIKNLGAEIADAIVAERKTNGPYKTFADFLERVTHKNMNRKSLESLIKAGALDSLGENRGTMLHNIEEALIYNQEAKKGGLNQNSLFGEMVDQSTIPTLRLKPAPESADDNFLTWEKELLGLYISGHPLERFRDRFEKAEKKIADIKKEVDNSLVVAGGILAELKEILTKSGTKMAFAKLADFDDQIEIVFFPRVLEQFRELIALDKIVAIRGKISRRNGEPSLVAEAIKEIS